jgi:hypothetical protein
MGRDSGGRIDVRVAAQHRALQRLQVRTRVQAEFIGEPVAGGRVHGERIPAPPVAVQGQHQLAGEPLAQRVPADQIGQFVHQRAMQAEPQTGVRAVLDRGQPGLGQATAQRRVRAVRDAAGQGFAAPEAERPIEQGGRFGVIGRGPRAVDQGPEPVRVHRRRVGDQRVAATPPDDLGSAGRHLRKRRA